jgi:hypothetical protein
MAVTKYRSILSLEFERTKKKPHPAGFPRAKPCGLTLRDVGFFSLLSHYSVAPTIIIFFIFTKPQGVLKRNFT